MSEFADGAGWEEKATQFWRSKDRQILRNQPREGATVILNIHIGINTNSSAFSGLNNLVHFWNVVGLIQA